MVLPTTMLDPIKAAKTIDVEYHGSSTDIRLPTSLLWLLVFLGIGMLTWNASIVWDQLKSHERRITLEEAKLSAHSNMVGHERSSRAIILLDKRLKEMEAEVDEQP